jgi:hypothetical protein
MADRGYSVPASGAAQHPQLFLEDEDELTDLSSIHSSITELRSQVEALRGYVGREFTDLKRDLQRVAACADCLVLTARSDTPPKDSNATNSRGEHLLLPIRTVFNAEYTAAGVCSGIPAFIYQRLKDEVLTLDNERPLQFLCAIMFSSLPNEKKSSRAIPVGLLHSDLKLFIARMLVVNCKVRAHTLETPQPSTSGTPSSQCATASHSETTGSDTRQRSVSIQVEWMERGYVREEIFEECRKEIDGVDGSESMLPQDFRAKRRKLQAEVEFRDSISRSILKHIYQMLHTFFRKGRDSAKKQFLQDIGYVIRPEAEAVVSFRDTIGDLSSDGVPFATLSNVEMSYPRSLNDDRNDEENERLYAELLSTHPYMQADVTYSVLVKGKHGREEKQRVNKEVNILKCALNFCVTLLHIPSQDSFWRVSVHSLRLVYIVALACRKLLVQYEEIRVKRSQRVGGVDFGHQTSDLYKTWAIFVPGGPVAERIVRDGTLVMTEEAFEVLCEQNRKDVTENIRDDENDDDGDVFEQDPLEGAELRML